MRKGILIFMIPLACLLMASCEKPMAPDFKSIENLNVSLNGFSSVDLSCDANFSNPNKNKIVLKNVNIDVDVDGKYLTTIEKEYDMKLQPYEDFTVPVQALIKFKDIGLEDALALVRNTANERAFHFRGKIKVKMYGMNFSIPIDHNENIRFE